MPKNSPVLDPDQNSLAEQKKMISVGAATREWMQLFYRHAFLCTFVCPKTIKIFLKLTIAANRNIIMYNALNAIYFIAKRTNPENLNIMFRGRSSVDFIV